MACMVVFGPVQVSLHELCKSTSLIHQMNATAAYRKAEGLYCRAVCKQVLSTLGSSTSCMYTVGSARQPTPRGVNDRSTCKAINERSVAMRQALSTPAWLAVDVATFELLQGPSASPCFAIVQPALKLLLRDHCPCFCHAKLPALLERVGNASTDGDHATNARPATHSVYTCELH